jgi:hypothetical protein
MEYKMNATGQYEPQLAYTTDPYEIELLKKPIGRWGKEWQKWIEDTCVARKTNYIMHCSWCIIPRQLDIDARRYADELSERYNAKYLKDRPNGDDFFAVVRWEREKRMFIEERIREDIIHVKYDYDTEQGRSLDEIPEDYMSIR